MTGFNYAISRDLKPLVPVSTFADMDQTAAPFSETIFSQISSCIAFHSSISFCEVVDFEWFENLLSRSCSLYTQ
jgi:hypothetical protein